MRTASFRWSSLALILAGACAADAGPQPGAGARTLDKSEHAGAGLAILGGGSHTTEGLTVSTVVDASDGLSSPRDVALNPNSPSELWIVNQGDHSMVIVDFLGTSSERATKYGAQGNRHFLAKPSSLSFGDNGLLATSQEEHEITQASTPWDFMGPTMWTSDRGAFDGGHGGHMDMLHNSPDGAGIAWAGQLFEWGSPNTYFVFDGLHESITLYDFQGDHGPGGADHSDGIVLRYVEGQVGYTPGVPSHMDMHHEGRLLYVADSGNNRIAAFNPYVGEIGAQIQPNYDGTYQAQVNGGSITTVVDGAAIGMVHPSGLEIHDGMLFVTDNALGAIVAFTFEGQLVDYLFLGEHVSRQGLMGIDFDDAGNLYVVDGVGDKVIRISAAASGDGTPEPFDF